MRAEGITGAAIPDTRGVPLPTEYASRPARHERPPARSGWFRRPSSDEFTPEQLRAAGYGVVKVARATKAAKAPKAAPTRINQHADHEFIQRLYVDEGLTIGEVAAQTGSAVVTVRRSLAASGVAIDPDRRSRTTRAARAARPAARQKKPTTPKVPKRRPTRYDHSAAVAEYLAGDSSTVVGNRHGVTSSAILKAVRAAGHQPRGRGPTAPQGPRSATPVDDIIRLYTVELLPIPRIAKQLGIGTRTARRALLHAGVTLRDDRARFSGGANRLPEHILRAAGDLYLTGLTRTEVAAELGIGVKAVDQGIQLVGAEPRPAAHIPGELKDLMVANGVVSSHVRAWAAQVGRDCPPVGLPSRALVEDYLLARRPTSQTA